MGTKVEGLPGADIKPAQHNRAAMVDLFGQGHRDVLLLTEREVQRENNWSRCPQRLLPCCDATLGLKT